MRMCTQNWVPNFKFAASRIFSFLFKLRLRNENLVVEEFIIFFIFIGRVHLESTNKTLHTKPPRQMPLDGNQS